MKTKPYTRPSLAVHYGALLLFSFFTLLSNAQVAPPSYAPTPTSENLLAYWQFNNNFENWPFNYGFIPGANNTTNTFGLDRDGSANQSLIVTPNNVVTRSGIGATQNAPFNLIGNAVTMHALVWINPFVTGQDGRGHIIGKRGNVGAAPFNSYVLMYESASAVGSHRVAFALSASTNDALISFPLEASDFNTWMFITATYDGANMRLYKNGVQVAIAPMTGNINPGSTTDGIFGIGGYPNVNGVRFSGRIDEAYVYTRALTAEEVTALSRTNDFLLTTPALAITSQSANTSVCLLQSQSRTFNVAVNRFPGQATFQWKKGGVDLINGGNISGATTSSLTINNITAADLGNYTCVVTSGADQITTNVITLSEGLGFNNLNGLIRTSALNDETGIVSVIGSGNIQPMQQAAGTLLTAANRFGIAGKAKSTSQARDHFLFNPALNQPAITLSFWYRHNGVSRNPANAALNTRGGLLSFSQSFPFNSSRGYLVVQDNQLMAVTSTGDVPTGIMMNDNTWKHITYSNNDGNYKLYVNGNLVASGNTGTYKPSTHPINNLGYFRNQVNDFSALELAANGIYDDIRVYNRELLDFEAASLAAFDNPEVVSITAPATASFCEGSTTSVGLLLENTSVIPVDFNVNGTLAFTGSNFNFSPQTAGVFNITYSVEPIGCNAYDFSFLQTVVTVNSNNFAVTMPSNQFRCSNDQSNLVLTANITGTTTGLTYQWFRNGQPVFNFGNVDFNGNIQANGYSGANTPSLRVGWGNANVNATYSLRISGGACTPFNTQTVTISLSALPLPSNFQITQSAPACLGSEISLNVNSIDNATQWGWLIPSNPAFTFNSAPSFTRLINQSPGTATGEFISLTAQNADGCLAIFDYLISYAQTPRIQLLEAFNQFQSTIAVANGGTVNYPGRPDNTIRTGSNQTGTTYVPLEQTRINNGQITSVWNVNGTTINNQAQLTGVDLRETALVSLTSTVLSSGCSRTIAGTFNVLPIGTLTPSATAICEGGSVTLTVAGAVAASGIAWTANGVDIPNSAGQNSITVSPTTTTEYTVITRINANQNTSGFPEFRHRVTINVSPAGTVEITQQPEALTEACEGSTITLSVAATGADNFQWKKDGVNIDGANSATLVLENASLANSGSYTVEVANNCEVSTTSAVAVVNITGETAITTGLASTLALCSNESLDLNIVASGANLSYTWFKDNVEIANQTTNSLSISSPQSGVYRVEVEGSCGTTQTSEITVTVNPVPVVSIGAVSAICAGESITLTATGADTFVWTGGVENGVAFTPTATTTYSVVGTSNGCESEAQEVTVTVNPIPVVTVEPVSAICAGESITLTASGADSFVWTGGVENGVAFTPTVTTTYSVVGTSNGCESEPETITVTVNPIPSVSVAPISALCAGESITLTASGADSFVWTGGIQNGVAFTPATSGDYTVVGTSNGCDSDPITVSVIVNELPTLSITAPEAICGAGEVTISATSTGTLTFPSGITNGVAFTLSETTTYEITTVLNGCTVSESITIAVSQAPNLQVPADFTVCANEMITLAASGASQISWTGGVENGVAFPINQTTTFTATGINAGCPAQSLSVVVTVNPIPVVTVEPISAVCAGESITLTASGAESYTWTGGVSNGVSFVPTASGAFTVIGTSLGCESEPVTVNVTVKPLPEPTVLYNTVTQRLETQVFDTYQWFFNGVEIAGAINQTHPTIIEGDYTVEVSLEGCVNESITFTLVTVGVKELSQITDIRIFPNPASQLVNVAYSGSLTERVTLTIFDMSGKAVGSAVINQSQQTIDVSGLAQGMYLFRIETSSTSQTKRIAIK
ncbi:MAG: LamG-like jellyroll fold domain-containing protein [Luteibaculaceae bacterium]